MNTTLTSRVLAGGTVAGLLLVGAASGVFGTFSTTLLSGNTCSGYGYQSGYGYGYDCTPIATTSGGGGGGSSSSSAPIVVTTPATGVTITPPAVTPAIVATDIAKSPYKSAIETLISRGVMNNVAIIAPVRPITRAEFMKVLSIAEGYTAPVSVSKKFGDLPTNNTLINYVNYGVSKGWVNVKNANFRPNDIITQGEIDKLISAVKGSATADTIAKPSSGVTRAKAAFDIVTAFYSK
jgi:S-layer homology domain